MEKKIKITPNCDTTIMLGDATVHKYSEPKFPNHCDSTVNASVYEDSMDAKRISDKQKEKLSRWKKIKRWINKSKNIFLSTYSKRNPIVNALLSLFLAMTIIVSLIDISVAIKMIFRDTIEMIFEETIMFGCIGMVLLFYSLFCIFHVWKFVIENQKNAVLPSLMGSTIIWYVILYFYVLVSTPNSVFLDEDGKESSSSVYILFVFPLILSLLLNIVLFGIVRLIMKIRKYGASAWTLLDIRRGERPKCEKISMIVFCLIWLLPVGVTAYYDFKMSHPTDKYPTHSTAKIGDYYYQDGTVSTELLPDKNAVGVVFSLETTEIEKQMGYTHGQIVCLSDISPNKMQWDTETKDYENYPNYTWENRLKALEDINGYNYDQCEGYTCLTINWDSMKYMEDKIEGLSRWYVPTAGQWAKIIENIGNVKVDRMLRFDSKIVSTNLRKIGINPQRWYWTITEFDTEYAWSIRIANGEFGSRTYKQNEAYVRPVASF